jgi:decaprenyl-phosphate phosphoribosyltransferase
VNAYLRALRLERWPRSAAILLGSAAYLLLHRESFSDFNIWTIVFRLGLSFALTWAISTVNYIVNEIVDAPYDAHHPVKRHRPLVQGEIQQTPLVFIGLAMAIVTFILAGIFFSRALLLSLLVLLLAGFVYNVKPIRTKDIPFLDAISESANNPIRFLIGWYAFAPQGLFPPAALLLAWWSFGNFLMTAKRLSEFRLLGNRAADYRLSHQRYSRNFLLLGMVTSALVFLVSYLTFAVAFRLRYFIYLSPLLLVYLFLFFRKTLEEREIMEEPESLLLNPLIALLTLVIVSLFALSFFL